MIIYFLQVATDDLHTHFITLTPLQEGVANSLAAMFLVTPSQVFFRLPLSKDRTASSSLILRNKKKSPGASSGE